MVLGTSEFQANIYTPHLDRGPERQDSVSHLLMGAPCLSFGPTDDATMSAPHTVLKVDHLEPGVSAHTSERLQDELAAVEGGQ